MPPGWSTLAILVSVIGGVQLLFLGIIGEYIGRVFEEVKDRPLYIVKEKLIYSKYSIFGIINRNLLFGNHYKC